MAWTGVQACTWGGGGGCIGLYKGTGLYNLGYNQLY